MGNRVSVQVIASVLLVSLFTSNFYSLISYAQSPEMTAEDLLADPEVVGEEAATAYKATQGESTTKEEPTKNAEVSAKPKTVPVAKAKKVEKPVSLKPTVVTAKAEPVKESPVVQVTTQNPTAVAESKTEVVVQKAAEKIEVVKAEEKVAPAPRDFKKEFEDKWGLVSSAWIVPKELERSPKLKQLVRSGEIESLEVRIYTKARDCAYSDLSCPPYFEVLHHIPGDAKKASQSRVEFVKSKGDSALWQRYTVEVAPGVKEEHYGLSYLDYIASTTELAKSFDQIKGSTGIWATRAASGAVAVTTVLATMVFIKQFSGGKFAKVEKIIQTEYPSFYKEMGKLSLVQLKNMSAWLEGKLGSAIWGHSVFYSMLGVPTYLGISSLVDGSIEMATGEKSRRDWLAQVLFKAQTFAQTEAGTPEELENVLGDLGKSAESLAKILSSATEEDKKGGEAQALELMKQMMGAAAGSHEEKLSEKTEDEFNIIEVRKTISKAVKDFQIFFESYAKAKSED